MKKNSKKNSKKKTKSTNIVIATVALLLLVGAITGLALLRGQKMANSDSVTLYLPTGSTYDDVIDSLDAHGCIGNHAIFNNMARLRHYRDNVKGGCYTIGAHDNVWNTLTKLYYGNQDPIRVTINKYRTKEQLCQYLDKKLELDGNALLALLDSDSICEAYGHNPLTIIGMFTQNTYDIYWNISPSKLLDRMKKESDRFWNDKRLEKCRTLKLTPDEVITLASIVEEETNKNDEKELIASVYLNRLRKGMLLQADPTLKFAARDFTLRRLLNKHTESDSPYNTYRFPGLPPGPICIPGPASIDAVLANRQSDYLYFCAKADFSGYHAFATTLAQHNANANAFHAELNRRKIYK